MLRALVLVASLLVLAPAAWGQAKKCPPDSVPVGTLCVDKYEESVWRIDTLNTGLIKKVQAGKATLADLQKFNPKTGVGVQLGCTDPPFNALDYNSFGNFPPNGDWVPLAGSTPPNPGVFAVSIPGVLPSTCITWFQANQACALSGKRLLRNDEWQRAASGTPNAGNSDNGITDCNTDSAQYAVNTGSRSSCTSNWGAVDMVGNVEEWVADWAEETLDCTDWTTALGIPGNDSSCFGGNGSVKTPGGMTRGGGWASGASAGTLTVGTAPPVYIFSGIGFRCGR